jgi:hypothetical protein
MIHVHRYYGNGRGSVSIELIWKASAIDPSLNHRLDHFLSSVCQLEGCVGI